MESDFRAAGNRWTATGVKHWARRYNRATAPNLPKPPPPVTMSAVHTQPINPTEPYFELNETEG